MGESRMRQGNAWLQRAARDGLAIVLAATVFGMAAGARAERAEAPATAGATASAAQSPFYISVVPTAGTPIRLGTTLGFNVSANTAGYASLYLINPQGQVTVLGENMVVSAARDLVYPSPTDGFTLTAAEPVGNNQVVLFVTRQPFVNGFSGYDTLTRPVSLALRAAEFRSQLRRRAAALPPTSWAMDEIQVRVVG